MDWRYKKRTCVSSFLTSILAIVMVFCHTFYSSLFILYEIESHNPINSHLLSSPQPNLQRDRTNIGPEKTIATMMRATSLLLLLAGMNYAESQISNVFESQRTNVSVSFEYQLEVSDSKQLGSTRDQLDLIDSAMLGVLQTELPLRENSGRPKVQFESIESEIFSACFTENDECSLVRSTISISYVGDKPKHSVEFVTLRMVQDYFNATSIANNNIYTTYTFPTLVSSLAQFRMWTVTERMNDDEIKVMEETFEEVFGAIVFAIEGDTEVVDSTFLYQDLLKNNASFEGEGLVLSTDLLVAGNCRDCTDAQYEEVIVKVINDNIPAFRNKLRINANAIGSDYFNTVEGILFNVPELPTDLPPIEDMSIYDKQAPDVRNPQPWFLWFGVSVATLILCFGACLIATDSGLLDIDDFLKDEFSTSQSDSEMSEEDDTEGLDQIEAGSQDDEEGTEVGTTEGKNSRYEVHVL